MPLTDAFAPTVPVLGKISRETVVVMPSASVTRSTILRWLG